VTEKILIFGASGRMGSNIIQSLPANVAIRAADLVEMTDPPPNAEFVHFNITQPPADLGPIFEDVKSMFLLWPPGTSAKAVMPPLIAAAEKHGVERVVFLSILGADQLKVVPHSGVEELLEASGMDYIFLRSAYFMQNLNGIHAPEIRDRDQIFIPAGDGDLGLVDVRDVAAVGAKALLDKDKNVAYSLTGPEALTFNQVAEIFSRILRRDIAYTNPGAIRFFRHMRGRGIPTGLVIFMIIEYLMTKLGKSGRVTDEVESILERPATSLEQFVADHAATWQQ